MTIMRCGFVRLVAIATISVLATLRLEVADATVIAVNTTSDPGSGTCSAAVCSLRDAIALAAPNDIITFAIPASDPGCSSLGVCSILLDAPSGPLSVSTALTMDGTGQRITIAGPGTIQLLLNSSSGLVINALTFANGNCFDNAGIGGTFHCLTGGGILNTGVLTVKNSTFSGNSGGESCFSTHVGCANADALSGGAIANLGNATIESSTFVGNQVLPGAEGAAIASFGGTVTVTNSTFSGNSGNTTVFNGVSDCCDTFGTTPGTVVLINSTIVGTSGAAVANQAATSLGVGTLTLSNTVLAGNSGGNCLTDPSAHTAVNDIGGNISDDASCGFTQPTSLNSTNPALGTLQDNGGPTQTIALLTGSPAAASGVGSACPATDQRGIPRPGSGQNCSSGAFQSVALSCPTATASVGVPYNSALSAIGGVAPYTFTTTSTGSLPQGLILDATTGTISGTPSLAGPYNFTGQAADSASVTATATCSIIVSPPLAQLTEHPSSVFFGKVRLLSLSIATVTVVNTGTVAVSMANVSIVPQTGGGHDFLAVSLCPASLPVGQSCRIGVALWARHLGTESATLLIRSSAQGSPQSIPLSAIVVR